MSYMIWLLAIVFISGALGGSVITRAARRDGKDVRRGANTVH